MYILIDNKTGRFVADQRKRAGSSFTNKLQYAKTFKTIGDAERNRCVDSERIMSLEEVMR